MSSTPTPRANVAAMPNYVPGKPPAPREGLTTFKLSSNENPYPPLPGVIAAATGEVERMNWYPDMGSTALYQALAARFDVPTHHLAVATGSVALIYQILQAFCEPGNEVVHAWRSFEAYPIAIAASAAVGVPVAVTREGRHDLDAMLGAVTDRTSVILLCTPNNPTGPALHQRELDAFLDRVPPRVLVVIDEAYVEFVRMDDPVDGVATHRDRPNVVVTRTFSKAYGLAGLRIGYALGQESVVSALRSVALPFGVSGIAQAAAIASLDAEPALLERVEALVHERDRVLRDVREAGWQVPEAQGNFLWIEARERTAELAAAADALGIVIRPFGDEGARISIGAPEANDRVIELARTFPAGF